MRYKSISGVLVRGPDNRLAVLFEAYTLGPVETMVPLGGGLLPPYREGKVVDCVVDADGQGQPAIVVMQIDAWPIASAIRLSL